MGSTHTAVRALAWLPLAIRCTGVNPQTIQALEGSWVCMRPNSDPTTGTIWAETFDCEWNTKFAVSPPNMLSDKTIRSGNDLCLSGRQEGAFFEKCEEGSPLQKWAFMPVGATAETLAAADDPISVPGQIVLADANMNGLAAADGPSSVSGQMCLQAPKKNGTDDEFSSGRVEILACDPYSAWQTWVYEPPPPSNKVLLFMPARHAAGESACVQMPRLADTWNDGPHVSDCDEEDFVAMWWVQDGDVIFPAMGERQSCLTAMVRGTVVGTTSVSACGVPDYDRWILGDDGSLTLIAHPEFGCLTWHEEAVNTGSGNHEEAGLTWPPAPRTHFTHLRMDVCTGSGNQTFAFRQAAPTTNAIEVV